MGKMNSMFLTLSQRNRIIQELNLLTKQRELVRKQMAELNKYIEKQDAN